MTQRTPAPDDTVQVPWATTRTMPYAGEPAPAPTAPPGEAAHLHVPAADGAPPEVAGATTAPALDPPTWSGRKTAIAAALAIGISSMGGVAAAAMLPAGSSVQDGRGFQNGQFGPGGRGGFGQQGTGTQQGTGAGPGGLTQQGQGQLPAQQGQGQLPGQQGFPGGPRDDDDDQGAPARTS